MYKHCNTYLHQGLITTCPPLTAMLPPHTNHVVSAMPVKMYNTQNQWWKTKIIGQNVQNSMLNSVVLNKRLMDLALGFK